MGRHHARVLRELPGVDLVALADPAGDPHGVAGNLPVLANVEALIEVGLDYAVVAVPTIYHEETALPLAAAGVHTLVEKPIAGDSASGLRIQQGFEQAGLIGAVGHIERFNPALLELRRRIEAGELGEIYQIATRRQGPFPARISDVGVGKDLAVHDIDVTSWLGGSPYASICAQMTLRAGRPHEDMVAITGQLANGIIVNHIVNWLSPMKERTTIVTGERGAFVADTLTSDLTFHANGSIDTEWDVVQSFRGVKEGDVTRYAFAKPEPLKSEHEALRNAINRQPSVIVTMAEGLATLKVAEAAITSATDRMVISL
jgi:predicted dehydrogenase